MHLYAQKSFFLSFVKQYKNKNKFYHCDVAAQKQCLIFFLILFQFKI